MWDIKDSKPLDRPVLVPASTLKIGSTTAKWRELEPCVAFITCEGGSVDDRYIAEVVLREQLAAVGIKQVKWSFDHDHEPTQAEIVEVPPMQGDPGIFHSDDRPYWYNAQTNKLYLGDQGAFHHTMQYHPDLAQGTRPMLDGGDWLRGRVGRDHVEHYGTDFDTQGVQEPYQAIVEKTLGVGPGNSLSDIKWSSTKTAHWNDIMAKAKRLIQSGNVQLLRNGYNVVVAHVVGDHGEYQCEISRDDPASRAITQWTCECPWDQYAFMRTRKWKKYEARPCAHVLAAYWKSLSTPLDEDYAPGQEPRNQPTPPTPASGAPVMGPPPGPNPGQNPAPNGQSPFPMGPAAPQGQMQQWDPMAMMMPSQTQPMMAPPSDNQVIPQYPMDPNLLQLPVSVPGGRPGPYPANPIQQPGTLSHVVKVTGQQFIPGQKARLNEATLGQSEGREGATDAGQWMEIPRNAMVEIRDQDASTGWVEVIYPLRGGPMTSYHVRCFVEPEKLTPIAGPSPFQNPKGKR